MRLRFLLLPLLLLAACQETDLSKKAPIPPAKMEAILTDLHFAEIYSSMLADSLHQVQAKNLDSLSLYYKEIFAHHKITSDEFNEGLNWYKENPEMLDSAYKRMIAKVGAMETAGQPK